MTLSQSSFLAEQQARYTKMQHELRQAFDPFGLMQTTFDAQRAWLSHPDQLAATLGDWGNDYLRWCNAAASRATGLSENDPFVPNPEDTRFADAIWRDSPYWDMVKEWYLFNTRWLQDALYATPELNEHDRARAAFWLRQYLNAIAPTNYFFLNPVAMAKALATRGDSVYQGFLNFARDTARGDIAMTDMSAFKVGENLGTTPGSVVYRGELLEVIHYEATTPTVHQVPIVIVSPWINKFYVLDLDARKSMVKFLVDQGFSVFITSWKNPGTEARDVAFDDYLTEGVARIVDVAREISGSEQVNLVGYCIGGTLVATYLAWLAKQGQEQQRIASATLLTSLTDFSWPGDIEVFLDEEGLAFVENTIHRKGYLDGKEMAASFRMLRANSLVWNYWVGNYLLGETPMPFDVLYWNMDATRMPERMHCYYLREFYFHNRLIQPDVLTIAGQPIDLGRIGSPLFMVSTEEDHIAPWKQTWKLTERVSAPVTFTLSTSGHILGIVNPPRPDSKRSYWQGPVQQGEVDEAWKAGLSKQPGSWWPSWVEWLRPRAGEQVKPKIASRKHPALDAAPGLYVLEP
ncbi:class I poly(R)-hydroxyalkanoic acid synthase [Chitiniphilus shinanonensis]|uniref:Class I poly(R)-hydroxyalkanoic acid synthase n=1 Tax=Chitiniphilus shinanonensis TaxID=553088 RepID=A0ABQ6BUX9_9NEIS|nr:alpha/beta fold hydrolase [Chitiniphilus shinanonensis]GLS03609.1 class I poly(R)-hydroxyalkanoic acid synthase [Chitiniphilus shinanonensis]